MRVVLGFEAADVEKEVARRESQAGKDAALAIGPGGVYAVWVSGGGVKARIPGKPQPVSLAAEGAFPQAIADYSAAIAKDKQDAYSLYGRGVAKLKSGDIDGGNADMAAAKAIQPDIANAYVRYGAT